MPFLIYPAEAVLKNSDLETSLQEIFGGVSYTVFSGNAHQINQLCSKQLQNLAEALASIIATFESGILLLRRVASFIESKIFLNKRKKVLMDFAAAGAGHTVRGPGAALLHKGTVVGGVMVADEEDGEGFPIRPGMTFGVGVTFKQGLCGGHAFFGMPAGKTSAGYEIVYFIYNDYSFFHISLY